MSENTSHGNALKRLLSNQRCPASAGILALACTLLLAPAAHAQSPECESLPAPAMPTVLTPVDQAYLATALPTYSGTGEPGTAIWGARVTFYGTETLFVTTVAQDGTWSYAPMWEELADGTYELSFYAMDACGETSASVMRTLHIDTEGPLFSIDSGPVVVNGETPAIFDFSVDEPGVTYECSVDNGPFAPCPDPLILTGLTEGQHFVWVYAVDWLGNPGPYLHHQWDVDLTAPDTSFDITPPHSTSYTGALFAMHSQWDATFECSLDGSAFAACENPVTYDGLAQGSHTVQVRAVDPAGNVDPSPATWTWLIQ